MHSDLFIPDNFQNFIYGSLVLGLVCSWAGNFLWNHASTSLPLSLAGQLTIFETIFGLFFVYLVEQRFPGPLELGGVTLMIGGILISFKSFRSTLTAQSAPISEFVSEVPDILEITDITQLSQEEEESSSVVHTGTM